LTKPAGSPQGGNYLHGYTGSTAETYATENGIPFVALDATVAVTGVSITESDQELKVDETVQLNAVVEPANATNKNVTWSSSDESIATVDENGLVTAVAQGTVTITVTTEDGNFTDSITVNSVPVGPQILLRCNSGIPEANVFITGSGFDVGAVGTIWFDTNNNGVLDDGEPSVNVKTDADGAIPLLTSLTVPSVSTGNYTVQADVPSGDGIEAAAVFTVTDVGIIVGPISGNSQGQGDVRYITVTGSGFAPSTSYRLFCDRNGNGIFDDGAYKSGTTTADGTVSVNNMSWPASPTGIYNILLDINKDDTIEASASIAITPGIKISTPSGIPGANIGMTLVGFSANETGYVWFDTNGNEVWDEGENQLPVTTSNGGSVNTSGLIVPSVSPGNYQVCTAIPACGLKASATYTVTGLTLNPNSGTAGTSIDILGYGYVANQTSGKYIWFDTNGNGSWDADESKVDVTTDASGILSPVSLTVPAVPAGTYNVCASVFPSGTFAVFTVKDPPAIDILYDGTVTLNAGETFTVTVDANEYIINENTPLGALHKASIASGFSYAVTDKKYQNSGILLLDDIGSYPYVKSGSEWYAYVNDVYKDGYENSNNALNLVELVDGDKVEFYYADIDSTDLNAVKTAATAAVLIVVDSDATTPSDWTLQLSGAKEETVTKAYFEQGLACASSSHQVSWTDGDGNTWGGVPLWLLVAMVDDDPDAGDKHINFNDELAVQDYEIKVIAGDGWSTTLSSAAIARSDAYIVANTLNGEPLPLKTESGKDCWPLYLKGSAISGGQQVGNIVRIELSGLPEPTAGWTLEMIGEVGDTITQEEFEDGLACTGSGHYQEWKDKDGNLWSGVPLWVLLGAVDDIETGAHWTFNNELASSYSVKVIAGDGNYFKTFAGSDVAESNDYIVANKCNGEALTGSSAPLRLVGDGVTKDDGSLGGLAVGNIARIEIPELQTPAAEPGSWNLALNGKISDVISQTEFEAGLVCPNSGHLKQWKDADGNVWSGIPLWLLAGWVDDRKPHSYDYNQAVIGYKVLVKAGDGYSVDFASAEINKSSDYIIANKFNGVPLTDSGPLRLVGTGVAKDDGSLSGKSVGNIVEIELTSFATGGGGIIPELRIVKYAEDGTTILAEETLNYIDMKDRFKVIGDGTTVYKFQGITNDPENIWDPEETNLGGFKIANAVMGTRLKDLCELVGGMGAGTEIVLAANDGYETKLPYSSIYTDPSVQARQGDAILAWYADGKYVPEYRDGMRLFFTPEDTVYSQWDMHETLPEPYWHYYGAEGVMYPSCAGLSAKYITEIKVYSVPQGDWTLELDGQDIGGLKTDISKTYFESALTCQFGANHKATYTDSKERTWEGMPLWFLVGFVDDADQHSNNAYNDALAESGYQVVITAEDGYSVTIDSTDLGRNNNYIIANSLNGATIPETDENWPLRLVGPAVTGTNSISQIVSIKLVSSEQVDPVYTVSPVADAAYTAGTNPDGINTMTVNTGVSGFKYFTVDIEPVASHSGDETVVFTHLRNGIQLQINSTRADFDEVDIAQAGFNVQSGDVIKVYIVDELTNATDHNPVILQ
jgi:DMSO/TMAO reductase YedYZ molybdopterin-dependent catalytic subunit